MPCLHTSFGDLLVGAVLAQYPDILERPELWERLNFDQLFRVSDPERVERSRTVRGPALEVMQWGDSTGYAFNFKSNPSTTGLRHRGYIRFYKPRKKTPLEKVDCLVDCECPDYKYRWAWANKQRRASVVGPNSLNQAWDKAPKITNPGAQVGLCKHILALRDYIYGQYEKIGKASPEEEEDADTRLAKMTHRATKRWIDYSGAMLSADMRTQMNRNLGKARRDQKLREPEGTEGDDLLGVELGDESPAELPASTGDFVPPPPPAGPPGYRWRSGQERIGDSRVFSRVNHILKLLEDSEALAQDSDDAVALDLLREIRDGINKLAGIEEPEVEVEGDEGLTDIDVEAPLPVGEEPPRPANLGGA